MTGTEDIGAYLEGSDRALAWLVQRLGRDARLPGLPADLTCFFKPTYLFTIAGRQVEANQLLQWLVETHMQPDGDFLAGPGKKSLDVDYYEKIWPYANAWIAFTAHKLGRFDVSYPAYAYLKAFRHPASGGFHATRPGSASPAIDLLATTHIGHTALYLGDLETAISAARAVERFLDRQPSLSAGLYLRMSDDQELIRQFPESESGFYFMSATEPAQFYFMAGYPIAFLGKLYRLRRDRSLLECAIRYFDLVAGCKGVFDCHFSHKAAWGAAILSAITGERRYADFALKVSATLLAAQNQEGVLFPDAPPSTCYDQTAECAIWIREICAELATPTP